MSCSDTIQSESEFDFKASTTRFHLESRNSDGRARDIVRAWTPLLWSHARGRMTGACLCNSRLSFCSQSPPSARERQPPSEIHHGPRRPRTRTWRCLCSRRLLRWARELSNTRLRAHCAFHIL